MHVCIIGEAKLLPVPDYIKVMRDYGQEVVVNEVGHQVAVGSSLLLEAEPKDFVKWLHDKGDVWLSNSSALGEWKVARIKENI